MRYFGRNFHVENPYKTGVQNSGKFSGILVEKSVEKAVECACFFGIGNRVKYMVNQQVMQSCDFEHVHKHTSMENPR